MTDTLPDDAARVLVAGGLHKDLLPAENDFGADGWAVSVWKAVSAAVVEPGRTAQGVTSGTVERPFDFAQARLLRRYNSTHARALWIKVQATVGLGWVTEKIPEVLDLLCEYGSADLQEQVMSDVWELGNGYIEVVRDAGGKITGLHYADAETVEIVVAPDTTNPADFYFTIGGQNGTVIPFRRFGHDLPAGVSLDSLTISSNEDPAPVLVDGQSSAESGTSNGLADASPQIGELIHFRLPAAGQRYYGMPRWLSAVPAMELAHCRVQYLFDFFLNRCIPESVLIVSGPRLDDVSWKTIKDELLSVAGKGNQRRTIALNIPNGGVDNMEVQFVPLGGQTDTSATTADDTLGTETELSVVSAHGVPPLLAGIQIPGKMGAANELTNAMMAFQVLEIAPVQKAISAAFARTLGNPAVNGGLGLTVEDFTGKNETPQPQDPNEKAMGLQPSPPKDRRGNGLRTILEEIDMGQAETVGKMRMSILDAKARGRDLSAGPAQRGSDIAAGRGAGTTTGGAGGGQ